MPMNKGIVKPIVKLTKKQWEELLTRVVKREEKVARKVPGMTPELRGMAHEQGRMDEVMDPAMAAARLRGMGAGGGQAAIQGGQTLSPRAIKQLMKGRGLRHGASAPTPGEMMKLQPPETRYYGRLYEPAEDAGSGLPAQPRDYPLPEAIIRYIRGEGRLKAETGAIPPVDVLDTGKGRYERRLFKQVKAPGERVKKAGDYVEEERQAELRAESKAREKVTAGRKKAVQKSVEKVSKTTHVTDDDLATAMMFDQIWKNLVKGKRTTTGRFWEALRSQARGRKVEDARDYFIRSGLRWSDDPERFAKRNKREAKSLEELYNMFMDMVGGGGKE